MKLIAGLGNPGRRYAGTRHNIGFEVLDLLARRHGLDWETAPTDAMQARWRTAGALLVKPLTYMNRSGFAVGELLRFYKVAFSDLLVVVDEVQLGLGRLRARPTGSAGGHNGLKSLIEQLGTEDFARLRIGVGRGDARRELANHVLAVFDPDERETAAEAAARAADAVELFVAEGIGPVMNRFNRRDEPTEDPDTAGKPERNATREPEKQEDRD